MKLYSFMDRGNYVDKKYMKFSINVTYKNSINCWIWAGSFITC